MIFPGGKPYFYYDKSLHSLREPLAVVTEEGTCLFVHKPQKVNTPRSKLLAVRIDFFSNALQSFLMNNRHNRFHLARKHGRLFVFGH